MRGGILGCACCECLISVEQKAVDIVQQRDSELRVYSSQHLERESSFGHNHLFRLRPFVASTGRSRDGLAIVTLIPNTWNEHREKPVPKIS